MKYSIKANFAVAAAAAAAATLVMAPSAHAEEPTQYRNHFSEEVCKDPGYSGFKFTLWFNSDFKGSYRNIGYNVYDFSDEHYGGTPAKQPLSYCWFGASSPWPGSGQGIKNNAASAANRHATYMADVYYNSGYKGAVDDVAWTRNLNYTKNNNASFAWRV
ncbi:hypothetical protein [Streptomyces sp. NBC_01006]|uniref:hypothetical protein n=1 Tax=Streptomyces sp. NBC_01006 TaxID=2903716 RepID=UPI002F907953|nr:hypothetical protein OG509_42660 [Streptomyces sp. NBC_01006]